MPVGCNPAELHPEQDWDFSARVHLPYTLFSHFNMAFHILLLYSTVSFKQCSITMKYDVTWYHNPGQYELQPYIVKT
jgi:hypothetical protein